MNLGPDSSNWTMATYRDTFSVILLRYENMAEKIWLINIPEKRKIIDRMWRNVTSLKRTHKIWSFQVNELCNFVRMSCRANRRGLKSSRIRISGLEIRSCAVRSRCGLPVIAASSHIGLTIRGTYIRSGMRRSWRTIKPHRRGWSIRRGRRSGTSRPSWSSGSSSASSCSDLPSSSSSLQVSSLIAIVQIVSTRDDRMAVFIYLFILLTLLWNSFRVIRISPIY